ncbi:MAG: response regulator [Vicinamibacterales bacterium]
MALKLQVRPSSRKALADVNERVLIVDDDADWLSAAVESFSSAGYVARGASTFPIARQLLESFGPDLLITDIRLGEYNGLYLLVRAPTTRPKPACLIISGFEDPVLMRDARLHGAYDFLVKPVDTKTLLAKAAEALAARNKRRWPRKQLSGDVPATIAGQQVRLIDVSYGGLRMEVPFAASAGVPLEITIASMGRTIPANTVWAATLPPAGIHQCGAAVRPEDEVAVAWRHIVDALTSPAGAGQQ